MLNKTRRQYTFREYNCKLSRFFTCVLLKLPRIQSFSTFPPRFAVIFVHKNFGRLLRSWQTCILCFAASNAAGFDISITFVCGFSIYGDANFEYLYILRHNMRNLESFPCTSYTTYKKVYLYIFASEKGGCNYSVKI